MRELSADSSLVNEPIDRCIFERKLRQQPFDREFLIGDDMADLIDRTGAPLAQFAIDAEPSIDEVPYAWKCQRLIHLTAVHYAARAKYRTRLCLRQWCHERLSNVSTSLSRGQLGGTALNTRLTHHCYWEGTATADACNVTQGACRASSRRHGAFWSALLMLLVAVFSSHAKAQSNRVTDSSSATQESYDTLLDEAVTAFDASDFARARTLFERAYELRPNSRVLRGMGIAALRLERFSEAYRTLTASLKHPVQPLTASQREEVTGLLSWMETSLARIKLRWTPAEPAEYELLVDDKALRESAIWLPAGTHRLVVRAPGYGVIDRTITLAPEQHEVIELTPQKREPPAVAAKPKRKPSVTPADAAHSLPAPQKSAAAQARHTGNEQRDSDPSDGGSVLTRWWFWTAVAVVAAGGVATAVLLSQPPPTAPIDTSEGGEIFVLSSRGLP